MDHEWLPQTPAELRKQARKFQMLAAHVLHVDLARRLEEQAAELLAKAELSTIQADPLSTHGGHSISFTHTLARYPGE